jgi:hypothetical protein
MEHEKEQTSSSRMSLTTYTSLVDSFDTAHGTGSYTELVHSSSVTNSLSQYDYNILIIIFYIKKMIMLNIPIINLFVSFLEVSYKYLKTRVKNVLL